MELESEPAVSGPVQGSGLQCGSGSRAVGTRVPHADSKKKDSSLLMLKTILKTILSEFEREKRNKIK